MPAYQRRSFHRCFNVVDREHEQLGLAGLRRLQQFETRCIAIVNLVAVAAHEIDLLVVRIECGKRYPAHSQYAGDDLTDASVAGDDYRIGGTHYGVVFWLPAGRYSPLEQALLRG